MTSLEDKMLAKVGAEGAAPQSNVGKMFRRRGVTRTTDFERVKFLPRRNWREGAEELAENLTIVFGKPPSNCSHLCACRGAGTMRLKPVQAAALNDIHDYGGIFAPIVVGGGKTLVSFLAPKIVGAQRPLLLVPANLRRKTEQEWWKLSVHWQLPPTRIESYEKLGVMKNEKMLEEYRPDFIFADEGHRLGNTSAAVTRRVMRFLQRHGEETIFCVASGTLATKALRDYWHLIRASLGDDLMPMPKKWEEMMEWGECLDVGDDRAIRMAPGCLAELCPQHPMPTLEQVRVGYQRRLVETPGVVATDDKDGCPGSLSVSGVDIPGLDAVATHYKTLRDKWQTPDGWDFSEAVELWRHARELVCGFYNVWDPRPPIEWMVARRNWHRFARGVLQHSKTVDTDAQVAKLCATGKLSAVVDVEDFENGGVREADVYAEWVAIRDTFVPNPVPVWVDDSTLRFAAAWLENNDGIVWTEHPCFGEKLSKMTGVPYFGRQGLDASGTMIENASGPVIASVLANSTGRNLQTWSRSLVVSCPPNGKMMEQLLGRTHRQGQQADEISYTFVLACREQLEGFYRAIGQAEFIEQTTGQPQKLLYADRVDIMSPDELGSMVGPRW